MNELDPGGDTLIFLAHNFEKQKNESNLIEGGKKKVFLFLLSFFCFSKLWA